jgi:hypothetical protein
MKRLVAVILHCCCSLICLGGDSRSRQDRTGSISGASSTKGDVRFFKGIPYAAPAAKAQPATSEDSFT